MPRAMETGEELRLLVIGAGKMGQAHAQAFGRQPGVRIVGVASRQGDSAARLAAEVGAEHSADWRALAERLRVDACVVAVVATINEQITREVLSAGYHVLSEKPVAFTEGAVRALADMAAARNLVAMAAVNRRFFAPVLSAIESVRYYGRLLGVTALAPSPVAARRAEGRHSAFVCDHWMLAQTIHVIDLLRLAAGEPEETLGLAAVDAEDGETNVAGLFRFSSGALVSFDSFSSSAEEWELRLHGERVEARLCPLERGWLRVGNGAARALPASFAGDKGLKLGLGGQAAAFVAAVRELAPPAYPASDFYDHARTITLAEQLRAAGARGCNGEGAVVTGAMPTSR
ncbi:MAG: Gfo/Idh/MocA family oxidoreductase [Planctomycetia bacterium]|nr:Gfo/Idh/MocA family oxidoreductase [Planctomycetia bacterium]